MRYFYQTMVRIQNLCYDTKLTQPLKVEGHTLDTKLMEALKVKRTTSNTKHETDMAP